jgi:hypothetical protein
MVPGAMINSAGRDLFTSLLVQTRVPARPADESTGAASTTPADSGTDSSTTSPESDAQATGKQSVNSGEHQAQLRLERAQHQLKMLKLFNFGNGASSAREAARIGREIVAAAEDRTNALGTTSTPSSAAAGQDGDSVAGPAVASGQPDEFTQKTRAALSDIITLIDAAAEKAARAAKIKPGLAHELITLGDQVKGAIDRLDSSTSGSQDDSSTAASQAGWIRQVVV